MNHVREGLAIFPLVPEMHFHTIPKKVIVIPFSSVLTLPLVFGYGFGGLFSERTRSKGLQRLMMDKFGTESDRE